MNHRRWECPKSRTSVTAGRSFLESLWAPVISSSERLQSSTADGEKLPALTETSNDQAAILLCWKPRRRLLRLRTWNRNIWGVSPPNHPQRRWSYSSRLTVIDAINVGIKSKGNHLFFVMNRWQYFYSSEICWRHSSSASLLQVVEKVVLPALIHEVTIRRVIVKGEIIAFPSHCWSFQIHPCHHLQHSLFIAAVALMSPATSAVNDGLYY